MFAEVKSDDDFIDRWKHDYSVLNENQATGMYGTFMWSLVKVISSAEYIGSTTSSFLGLTESRYQFAEHELEHLKFVQSIKEEDDSYLKETQQQQSETGPDIQIIQ